MDAVVDVDDAEMYIIQRASMMLIIMHEHVDEMKATRRVRRMWG